MDFEEFTNAKKNAYEVLQLLQKTNQITQAHALKKYMSLLEAWNDKMIEALEMTEAQVEEKTPGKIDA